MLGGRCDVHDVTIRAAVMSDAEAITALAGELGYATNADAMRARLEELLPSSVDAVLVAEIAGEVVAWIHVARVVSVENDAYGQIRGLVVASMHRSRAIGAQLVAAAESWARERHLTRMRVVSNTMRERTHNFYQRLEYTVTKTQKAFDKAL